MKEFSVREFNDEELVIASMARYNSKTKIADDQMFRNMEKKCYGFYVGEDMKAFATVLTYKGIDILGYTWDDGTFTGMKAYALGADFIDKKYQYLKLGVANSYNKASRRASVS